MPVNAITEGTLVATVARRSGRSKGGGKYPVWTGAVYMARTRLRDGALTWRRVGSFGEARTGYKPSGRFLAELKAVAEHPWLDGVRHGDTVPAFVPADWGEAAKND